MSCRGRQRLLGSALLVCTGLLAGSAAAAPPPVEHYTRDDFIGSIKVAPDGRHFAVTVGNLDGSGILFLESDNGDITGGLRAQKNGVITHFDWVTPERVLFQVAERWRGSAFAGDTGELFVTNIDGRGQRLLFGARASGSVGSRIQRQSPSYASGSLVSTLPDDPRNVLISEQPWRLHGGIYRLNLDARPRLLRLDIGTGRTSRVGIAPLAAANILTDRAHRPRFALGFDADGRFRASWKPEPDGDWETFALPGVVADSVQPVFLTADDQQLYFLAVPEPGSRRKLFRLQLADASVEQLFEHERFDVSGVLPDPGNQRVVGAWVEAEQLEYHWFDPDDPAVALYRALERFFEGQSIRFTSATPDGQLITLFVHSDVNPGDYYLFDVAARDARYITGARGWINPTHSRPKESFWIESRDGLPLHGYLTRPDDGPGPHPLVLLPHGGPHGVRDVWAFDWEVQLLASRGFAVLQPNFRGSAGYGRQFENAGFRQWGGRIQDDLEDAVRWALAEGLTETGRICVMGTSFGAYSALMQLSRSPDLYACAVANAGVYDLALMRETGDIRFFRGGRSYMEEAIGSDPEELRAFSPVHHAASVSAPLLLIHGEQDWRADIRHARALRRALDEAGRPYEWMGLAGEGHGVFDESTRADVYRRILGFLSTHIGVRPVERGVDLAGAGD